MVIVYFEEPYVTINYDELSGIVMVEWRNFFTSDKLREASEKILMLIKEKKAKRLLTDTSKSGVVTPADQDWIANNWQPRAIAAGLNRMATVVPQKLIAQMAMDRLRKLLNKAEANFFASKEEAKAWLISS